MSVLIAASILEYLKFTVKMGCREESIFSGAIVPR